MQSTLRGRGGGAIDDGARQQPSSAGAGGDEVAVLIARWRGRRGRRPFEMP